MFFPVPIAIAELERATLPSLQEAHGDKNVPCIAGSVSVDNKISSQKEFAEEIAKNMDTHRVYITRKSAHYFILANLYLAKAEDCVLSNNMHDAEKIISIIDSFCKRNISVARSNIRGVESDAKEGLKQFRSHASIIRNSYAKYVRENKQIVSLLESKLLELNFIREQVKLLRGYGETTSSVELYKRAIEHVVGKKIEPRKVADEGDFGVFYVYDIPIPEKHRRDRRYKRDLENKIHDAVADAKEDAVGEVGINWVVSQESEV